MNDESVMRAVETLNRELESHHSIGALFQEPKSLVCGKSFLEKSLILCLIYFKATFIDSCCRD